MTLLNTLAYSGLGAVKGWAWGDGVAYARSFDGLGRLQTYPLGNPAGSGSAAGLTRTVGYDDAGRINSFTHSGTGANPSGFDQTFGYDGLDRLTANQQATSYGYGYDASGNRTSLKVAANTYAQTIAPTSNRVTTETNATGSKSLLYDTAGNLQSDGTYAYTYSDRGRLSRVTVGTATGAEVANYRYNGLEQRVVKYGPTAKVDGGARFYAYDEAGHLIGEYDNVGNPVYEVVYLGDTPVAVLTQTRTGSPVQVSTQVHYVYADHLDTPRVIVQSSNHAIRWRWDQAEAFGNSPPNENPNALGAFSFNLRFPGQTFDKETGWHYNHHRDYRPGAGRYAQSDPIGLEGGINTYAYVGGNPLSAIDPRGLDCIWHQNSGTYSCFNRDGDYYLTGQGYAGTGEYRNVGNAQNEKYLGPLPKGCYKIGGYDKGSGTGPFSLRLLAMFSKDASNSKRDLDSFLIHGNFKKDPSQGCPVIDSTQDRQKIGPGEIFCVVD